MKTRRAEDLLFEQVARMGKALASPVRLELLDLLAQGEKTVETLAADASIDVRLTSAHLRVLKEARLVETQRNGRFIIYRLSGNDVTTLLLNLRSVAEKHLAELRLALDQISSASEPLTAESRATLLEKARSGEIIVIDVRPAVEYRAGHLPFARSIPLVEIERRLAELPADKEIVAYCRGPFCLMSEEAAELLRKKGLSARRITDGVAEWAAEGLPIEV